MTFKSRFVAILAVSATLVGCAIHQTVRPVERHERLEGRDICVIENPAVRATFVEAYKRSLTNKGFVVRQLPASAAITQCPITSTYTANWRWDLALYMAYADIKVFSHGNQVGQATYDSMSGSANMNKFIAAERKIDELVNQLFRGGAGI
jgi:hypothetical protein